MEKKFMGFEFLSLVVVVGFMSSAWGRDGPMRASRLEMFVDELPDMPRIRGYDVVSGVPVAKSLHIGMYHKKWKFHRDLPPTPVFAYGTWESSATVPGPTIEALHGIETRVKWKNHLPPKHILPWDPTVPTATPQSQKGIPTVVHLHGGIHEPNSDGLATSWFTSGFRQRGPTWAKRTYHYNNFQHPGTLWYHDHAMGLTRVNLLAGLVGAYVIRQPSAELALGLPYDEEFDRPLVVFDRSFCTDGSIFMNSTGNNPSVHPQWRPEYFGDAIVVNGKAWPRMTVRRRKYRFRIINASNARFFKFYFTNRLGFIHVGSDSAYNAKPEMINELLVAPSEIADVIIDFSKSSSDSAVLYNDAPSPYPSGDPVDEANSQVMKFIVKAGHEADTSKIPSRLIEYPSPNMSDASVTRYITLYEHMSGMDNMTSKDDMGMHDMHKRITHFDINGMSYDAPATETPKVGSTEIWNVINLSMHNHPMHIHLGLFVALDQTELVEMDEFKKCMIKVNDAIKCNVDKYTRGKKIGVPAHEKGWKNVYKMMPGYVTRILVRFSFINSNTSYPFDATAEPGYVYHCHILGHEDNVMMRPLKLVK